MKHFSHKVCRRHGVKLCQSDKCPVMRRNYPPGVHGPKGKQRQTQYGMQLAEKQKAKAIYNVLERQFRKYYEKATTMKGDTGHLLLQLLESRFDNVIYRAGLAKTRPQARQLVNHSFFLVNGKRMNIPSYQIRVKDEITIKPVKQGAGIFNQLTETMKNNTVPSWLSVNATDKIVKVTALPKADEAEQGFNPRSIIELYSK